MKKKRCFEYEPIPFYFLNDTFDKDEAVRQLDVMKENEIRAFFLHVRDGILDEAYGTSLFFERVKIIVSESAKRGIKVWLYDEDAFPSGNAGGLIAFERPELRAYSLKVVKLRPEEIHDGVARRILGKVKGLYGYRVDKNGNAKKIGDCFGTVRRNWYRKDMDKTYYCDMQGKLFFPHVRAATSYSEVMFEAQVEEDEDIYVAYLELVKTDSRYGYQADCLNKETTEEFISRTHEKYAEYVGDYFGSIIPGIFLDEPSAGGVLPYTKEVEVVFKTKRGYDVSDYYYMLSPEFTGDGRKVRREYIETVTRLFRKNFIGPIVEWCGKHGLKATGHFYGEEDPLSGSLCAQSVYRQSMMTDIPGFDIIGRYVGDREHCALILGSAIVVSSATQNDKTRILAECFALNPFNFGYDGLRKIGDWLFACGINLLVPHAFFYSYGAYQRCDAGKSFFFQDPQFDEYLRFSEYVGRVCKLLCDYKRKNDALLVYPSSGFMEEVPFPICNAGVFPGERARQMQENCYAAVRYLIKNQIGFDVTDAETALNATVENGKLKINKCAYGKVIVIKGGEVEDEVYNRLGTSNVDAVLFDGKSYIGFPNAYGIKGDNEDILAYEKYDGDEKLLFVYRNASSFAEILVPVKGAATVYDAEKDEYLRAEVKDGYVRLGVNGYDSVILLSGRRRKTDGEYSYEVRSDRVLECESNPQWTYMPKGASGVVTRYDVEVGVGADKRTFTNRKYPRLRDLIGTSDEIYASEYVIPYFDTAPRTPSAYPKKAVFKAEIEKQTGKEAILWDGGTFSGDYKIFWNGKEVSKDEIFRHRVYDVKNEAFEPIWKDGTNVMEIVFDAAFEFDGVNGEIYLYDLNNI